MWTKSEDLQDKSVKLSSQQDYETVTKVLHEFGFKMYDGFCNDKYYETYPYISIYSTNTYANTNEAIKEIPIQQFYDYLSSKILKVEDLVEGEIYYVEYRNNNGYLNLSKGKTTIKSYLDISSNKFRKNETATCSGAKLYRIATPEEKKWLNVCIKQDKFIPKTDLDLYDDTTFELKSLQTIPEYVECISWNGNYCKPGEIYPITKYNSDITKCEVKSPHYNGKVYCTNGKFKFSTKEAFEAQNKPMEKSLVGRYLKALVDSPQSTSVKKGEYVKILDFYYEDKKPNKYRTEDDWCYTTDNSTSNHWELMPEEFNPPNETSEWIPQVGDYAISLIDTASGRKKGDLIKIISKSRYNLVKENRDEGFVSTIEDTSIYKTLRKAEPHEIPNNTPRNEIDYPVTPNQAIKSIFDKDFNNPLNEVLELPKSSKKKTKQLIY